MMTTKTMVKMTMILKWMHNWYLLSDKKTKERQRDRQENKKAFFFCNCFYKQEMFCLSID